MAFVAEDGTGLSNANSYVDVAWVDAYFTDRGYAQWTGNNADKQKHLILATDYMEGRFASMYAGEKLTTTQALSFPRKDTGMPIELKKACAEYAVRSMVNLTLAPDPVTDSTGNVVSATKKKVGPIETETQYAVSTGSTANTFKPYPIADMWLSKLLKRTSGSVYR